MATTFIEYSGNGTNKNFTVTFPYISRTHVKVYVNGSLKTVGTDYSWLSSTVVQFNTAPVSGAKVLIQRVTPSGALVDFVDGSTLSEIDLDLANRQALYLSEEGADKASAALILDLLDGTYDATGRRIKNVAVPVDPNDAVNKAFADDVLAQATQKATDAAASASAATGSANAAANSASAASGSASTASTKAGEAAGSASAAASSATTASTKAGEAATSATAAATSATNASTSATNASGSATAAATSASAASTSAGNAAASATTATTKAGDAAASATAAATSESNALASKNAAAASAAAAAASANSGSLMGRNKLINGDFSVSQILAYGSGLSIGAGSGYAADRWLFAVTQSSKLTVNVMNNGGGQPSPYSRTYLGLNCAVAVPSLAAGDYFQMQQRIEGVNIRDLMWGTSYARPLTISFWAFNPSAGGTYSVVLTNGAGNRTIGKTYTLTAGVPKYVTLTFPGCTDGVWALDSNVGICVVFGLAAGSTYTCPVNDTWLTTNYVCAAGTSNFMAATGTVYLTDIQAEVGVVATPFDRKLYTEMLTLCQRYYQVIGNIYCIGYSGVAGMVVFSPYLLPVQMKSTPTCNLVGVTYSLANSMQFNYVNNTSFMLQATSTSTGQVWANAQSISFQAEL